MKKKYLFLSLLIVTIFGYSQSEDFDPNVLLNQNTNHSNNVNFSTLTTEFLYDIGTSIGAQGNAGVVFINNQFWVSAWASNNIHVLSNTGAFIETFQVAGLTGTRSMTTDGTNVYCGTSSTSIYVVNPVTRTLTSTIAITTTSNATARFCAYDASLNSGAGGFWIANFNTDIASVSMTGSQLSVIPAATHTLTGMYGAAVDGSGLLYVYHQAGTPSNDVISSINLTTGLPTGVVYDFYTNDAVPAGSTSSLAGGLFISTAVVPGETILVGVSQATPNNLLYGLNIDLLSTPSMSLSQYSLFPNPAKESLTINSKNEEIKSITIYNLLGQEIMDKNINAFSENLDISNLQKGNYIVAIKSINSIENFKIVKE
ncbi:T9SS type A sorting domain-containing protein [Flavobacterium sp. HNIBRBA15423]|uniref:T9SS type A sorting domain-containing protein n=1 Tax=Flavobacterium sp. HNIBRBA15423 TaxID=3458683 RepID=UPI00404492F3